MRISRKFLSSTKFIHGITFLGFMALWGVIASRNLYLLLPMALSFLGAICGGFIHVIDKVESIK